MKVANRIQTILCDDIRSETGNKFSLMGIYSKDIYLPKFPAILPKLSLCVMLENIKVDLRECIITLKCPKAEPMSMHIEIGGESPIGKDQTIFAAIAPFRAEAAGPAKFEIRFYKGGKPSIVHKFEIKKANQ